MSTISITRNAGVKCENPSKHRVALENGNEIFNPTPEEFEYLGKDPAQQEREHEKRVFRNRRMSPVYHRQIDSRQILKKFQPRYAGLNTT